MGMTPNSQAGGLTERIMRAVGPHLKPNTPEAHSYNRAYEAVYATLLDHLPHGSDRRPGFDCRECGHKHQGQALGFICIGCPCEEGAVR